MFWVWVFGLLLFLPGVLAFVWDFLVGRPAAEAPAPAAA